MEGSRRLSVPGDSRVMPVVPHVPAETACSSRVDLRFPVGGGFAASGLPGRDAMAETAPTLSDLQPGARSPGAAASEFATEESGGWLSVLRSLGERLDLALVIDASASMVLWRDTVHELWVTLESAGVFRRVRPWWLDTDTRIGESFLLRDQESPGQPAAHNPAELVDLTRRRVILVASDCVGAAWSDRRAAELLERWARTNHVSIVQMFPQRLWRRCAPPVASVQVRAREPAMENIRFAVRYRHVTEPGPGFRHAYGEQPSGADGVPVPVLRFDQRGLERWAQIVRGTAAWADIPAIFTGRAVEPASDAGSGMPARARVARFRVAASREAFQLACYLAFAPMTLPAMRFVQKAMLPASTPSHLAEVLLGGLLTRAPAPAASQSPVLYEFDPEVGELLRSSVPRSAGLSVLRLVTRHTADRSGRTIDVRALFDAPTDADLTALVQLDRRLASSARSALSGLGGIYADIAERLRSQLQPFRANEVGKGIWHGSAITESSVSSANALVTRAATRSGSWSVTAADHPSFVAQPVRGDVVSYPPSDRPGRERRGDVPAILIGVPPRNPYFTGREDLLQDIHERLTGKPTALVPHALRGYGGVGKTHLAIEYVYRYQQDYDLVCWISAEQPAIVRTTIADLAKPMNLPSLSVDDAVREVLTALRRNRPYGRWLLVFDNVNTSDDIGEFLRIGSGHVIVTSRSDIWTGLAQVVEVNVFHREESIAFLRSRLSDIRAEEADKLANRLDDLPLALEQAAAWQVETRIPAADYLTLFDERLARLREDERLARLQDMETMRSAESATDYYPLPVAVTWSLALDRLRESQPEVVLLLQLFAYFAPEPIPWNILSVGRFVQALPASLRSALSVSRERDRMIRDIKKYALAQVDYGSNRLQLHRLAQLVLREQLSGDGEREAVRHQAHMMIAAADPGDPDVPGNWERYRELWPHVELSGSVECQHREVREVVLNLTRYLYVRGSYDAGQAFAETALRHWRQTFPDEDQALLVLVRHQATILRALGRHAEAMDKSLECYRKLRRVYGDNDEEALSAGNLVGGTYRGLGRFKDALDLDRNLYGSHVQIFGLEHPRTLMSQNNLALDYFLTGDYTTAASLDEAVLMARRRVLGEENPFTLQSEDGYARDLCEAGNYREARNRLENTLHRYVAILGRIHPSTLRATKQLAVACRKAGDYDEALRMSEEIYAAYQSRLGRSHPDTLSAAGNLVNDLRITGNLGDAAALADETLGQYRHLLRPDHPFTLSAENNYAIVLRKAGRLAESRRLSGHSFTGFRDTLGPDHPNTLSAATTHANDLSAAGDLAAATELLEATYASFKRVLGPLHPYTLSCAVNLVQDLRATGLEEDATRLAEATMDRYVEALGPGHPEVATAGTLAGRSECSTDAPYT
jgi:Tetratricopeptide repeat/NB-ARC domain